MTTTAKQIEEAGRLIEQKRAADKPKLTLVKTRSLGGLVRDGYTVEELMAKAKAMGIKPATEEEMEEARRRSAERLRLQAETRHRQQRQEWARRILEPAGGFQVPRRYESYTPQTLLNLCGSAAFKAKKPAVLTMKDWADGELEKPGVLVTGEPGTGKTALALWAFRLRAERTGEREQHPSYPHRAAGGHHHQHGCRQRE